MADKRKFLEGELKFTEGKTSVENILTTISSELVKKGWVEYQKQGVDYPWTFDKNREIEIDDVFKKEHVKLFKIIGMTDIVPSGLPIGEIKVLKGVTSFNEKTIILRLNGKDYTIPLELDDTRELVATKIFNAVSVIEGFEDTIVEDDGVTVTIKGEYAVYELYTNYEVSSESTNDIVSFSKREKGYKTGVVNVLSGGIKDGSSINITLNDDLITVNASEFDSRIVIAEKIRDEIIANTDFKDTYIIENDIAGDGSNVVYSVHIEGELDVNTLMIPTSNSNLTNLGVVEYESDGLQTVAIQVYNTAIGTGTISITLKRDARADITKTISVNKNDSTRTIAERIRVAFSAYSANITNNIVTIPNITSVVSSVRIDTPPSIITTSEVLDARYYGVVEYMTNASIPQNTIITINGDVHTIPIQAGMSSYKIAEELQNYFLTHPSELFKKTTISLDGAVTIRGDIDVKSIKTNSDLVNPYPYTVSKIKNTDRYKGLITIIQPMTTDDNVVVTINGENIIVPLLTNDTEEDIATKIASQIMTDITGFELTVVDSDNAKVVVVEGVKNVESLSISPVEIPSENFDIIENVIIGTGDLSSGTNVGDNVVIKVIYTGEEFQRLCFKKENTNNGTSINVAKLKSRPQGDIGVYKDTVIKVTGGATVNNGDGLVYQLGKSPISKAKNVAHSVVVYKDSVVVSEDNYVIDYYNGLIIFKGANQLGSDITVDYGVVSGIIGDEIDNSKYKIIDNELIDISSTDELKDLDVVVVVNYHWDIVFPATVQQVDASTDRIILKTKLDSTQIRNKTFKKDYYVEFKHIKADRDDFLTGLEVRFGTMLDATKTSLDSDNCCEWARVAWYDEKGTKSSGELLKLDNWLPITYHMNFTQEYVNIVLHGSPVVDTTGRDNYLISPIMIGALENYIEVQHEDIQYNFGMTVGSDRFNSLSKMPKKWGDKTGTGITDFVMERTGDGVPYQAHGSSFHTTPEFMDKLFLGASQYTNSQHFSKMVITHEVQRERGMIQSMLVGDRSAIFHLDELITSKEEFNKQGAMLNREGQKLNSCGQANDSQEKRWVMLNINSPYWMINNSPNTFYGIALRKS